MKTETVWECTTESGRSYIVSSDGRVTRGGQAFSTWQVVDRDQARTVQDVFDGHCDVESSKPLVGKALYCFSFDAWVISTPLKTVRAVGKLREEEEEDGD